METKLPLPNSITVFTLSIMAILTSWLGVGVICAIIALVMAAKPYRLMYTEPGRYDYTNLLVVGRIVSLVSLLLSVLFIVMWIVIYVYVKDYALMYNVPFFQAFDIVF